MTSERQEKAAQAQNWISQFKHEINFLSFQSSPMAEKYEIKM